MRIWPGQDVRIPLGAPRDAVLARLKNDVKSEETDQPGTYLVGSVSDGAIVVRLHRAGMIGKSPLFTGRLSDTGDALAGDLHMSDDTVFRMVAIDVGALFLLGALFLARLSYDPTPIRTAEWIAIFAAVPLVFWLSAWADWRLGASRRVDLLRRLGAICADRA